MEEKSRRLGTLMDFKQEESKSSTMIGGFLEATTFDEEEMEDVLLLEELL